MRFNGKDLMAVHRCISISKEIPPGMPAREIATVEGARGEYVANVTTMQDEFRVIVNIAARTYAEQAQARAALAAWAMSSGNQPAELEPSKTPGRAYTAICKSISKPEERFGTVDVIFLLPRPVMHELTERKRTTSSATELAFMIGGSGPVQPVVSLTPDEDAQDVGLWLDGQKVLQLSGSISAGQTVEARLETGAVLVDGAHEEARIMWTECDLDTELTPGKHTLTASAAGTLTVRWHDEWL